MRYVVIDQLEPGDQVGKDVFDASNTKYCMVRSGTTLTKNLIDSLKKKGITGLYVEDELSKGLTGESLVSDKCRTETLDSLKSVVQSINTKNANDKEKIDKNFDKLLNNTEEIAAEIMGNSKMTIDLMRMANSNDEGERAFNICELALAVGKSLGFTQDQLKALATAALLQDIGKNLSAYNLEFVINKLNNDTAFITSFNNLRITKKEADQSDLEFYSPIYGYLYLKDFKSIIPFQAAHAILFSHVKENGSGYPFIIPSKSVLDKILPICNEYERLLREKNIEENEKYSPLTAKNKLIDQQQKDKDGRYPFDETIFKKFLDIIPTYSIGMVVSTPTGERAIVIRNNPGKPNYPVIRTENGEVIDLSKPIKDEEKSAIYGRDYFFPPMKIYIEVSKNNLEQEEVKTGGMRR